VALKSQLDNDIKAALLSGNRFGADVLRGLKAVILNEEVAKGVRDEGLDDASIEVLISKEVKKRQDSIQQYTAANRPELAEQEKAEMDVLTAYLPEQMTEEEIAEAVKRPIVELGAEGPQMMGQVIGAVKAKLGSVADGATVARLTKEALL